MLVGVIYYASVIITARSHSLIRSAHPFNLFVRTSLNAPNSQSARLVPPLGPAAAGVQRRRRSSTSCTTTSSSSPSSASRTIMRHSTVVVRTYYDVLLVLLLTSS